MLNQSLLSEWPSATIAYNCIGYVGSVQGPTLEGDTGDVLLGRKTPRSVLYDQIDTQTLRRVSAVLYCVTFAFGIVGNTLTIIGIAMNSRMKTVANCFMLNLALADDLFMVSLPFMAYSTVTRSWPFGLFPCKVLSVMHGVNCYASIFTMTAMSVDRYLAVVHPLTSIQYRKPRNAVYVCVALWVVCTVVMAPYWLYADTGHVTGNQSTRCQLHWPRESLLQHQWFWANFELVIGFVIPIVVMVMCYSKLLWGLVRGSRHAGPPLPDRARKPIRKVTAMVFTVTIVFIVCWTPYHLIKYLNVRKKWIHETTGSMPPTTDVVKFILFNMVSQALVFISSCCNPFIYCISSRNFRRAYVTVVCRCFLKSKRFSRYLQSTASGTGICLMARNGTRLRGFPEDSNRSRARSTPDICRQHGGGCGGCGGAGSGGNRLSQRSSFSSRDSRVAGRCSSLVTRSVHLPIYDVKCANGI